MLLVCSTEGWRIESLTSKMTFTEQEHHPVALRKIPTFGGKIQKHPSLKCLFLPEINLVANSELPPNYIPLEILTLTFQNIESMFDFYWYDSWMSLR